MDYVESGLLEIAANSGLGRLIIDPRPWIRVGEEIVMTDIYQREVVSITGPRRVRVPVNVGYQDGQRTPFMQALTEAGYDVTVLTLNENMRMQTYGGGMPRFR